MDTKFSNKQALWFTIINYFGVLIGTFSTLFIYPKDKDLLGIFKYIDGFAQIVYPIMVLGASTALLHFQPKLNNYLQRKLFSYSLVSVVVMIIISAIGVSILYQFDTIKNKQYFIYGFLIAICLAFVDVFKRQATNLQRLAIPTFYEKIVPKIALPVTFLLILVQYNSQTSGLIYYVLAFVLMLIGVGFYLFKYFKPVVSLNYTDLFKEIPVKNYYQYSLYAFCASLGSFFAFRIDSLMIPQFISNEANGDFSIGVNLANALMIPATGVFALYSPMISKSLKENDLSFLKVKYISVAKNLFFIGILMYGCVLLGMHDFFKLLPTANKLIPVLPVIYILGANVILNMATGFNTEIIAYSKYYKFNLVTILLLALINVSFNYYLLTQTNYGIVGVAIASLIAITVFNVLKLVFIYRKFGMLPINKSYIYTIVISMATLLLTYYIPININHKINFIVKCTLYVTVVSAIIYTLNLVPEFNNNIHKITTKFKRK